MCRRIGFSETPIMSKFSGRPGTKRANREPHPGSHKFTVSKDGNRVDVQSPLPSPTPCGLANLKERVTPKKANIRQRQNMQFKDDLNRTTRSLQISSCFWFGYMRQPLKKHFF